MNSAVHPWLGPVAGGISVRRLKHVLSKLKSGGTPDTSNPAFWCGEGMPWVAISDMSGTERVEATGKSVTEAGIADKRLDILRPGTLLYSMYASLGHVAELAIPATTNQAILGLEFRSSVHPRYAFWQLKALQPYVVESASSNTQDNLNAEKVRNLPFMAPPQGDQERIANFLDEQTARIDALIAEKGRLVETLGEYAHAEASRILTQGLRNAPVEKTGDSALPEAPAGWRVAPLKRALRGLSQGWSPQCENRPAIDGEWGVLKVGCVNGTNFNAGENKALPPKIQVDPTYIIRKGDVLVSRANTRELVGMAALVDDEYPHLLLCDKLYRLKLRPDWIVPEFAVIALRSEASRRQIELGASGASSSMQNISQDVIKGVMLAFPPLEEQKEVVSRVVELRESVRALSRHTEWHVDLLREYRSSLISAAVTGQLDIDAFQSKLPKAA